MAIEVTKGKWVIQMEGNAYPFFISEVKYGGEPSFTADLENAMKCNSQARAFIEIERVKAAGFTMPLKAEPLQIKYKLGDE